MMDERDRQRISLSIFFFLSGFCFASWTSRIPTIKATFGYNDAELGTILLCMPISSLAGLPVSGWLISRYDSRTPLLASFICMAFSILLIGFATSSLLLIVSICLFSFSLRLLNISVNTQSITIQKKFEKRIVGSFHGLWSTGGIFGVGVCTLLVALKVNMNIHLLIVSLVTLITTFICHPHLLRNDRAPSGNNLKIGKPDPSIVLLGLLLFFAAICEGGMFDWSGIYFREVVGAEIFTWGYLTFMICMASARFASDILIEKFGIATMYTASACFMMAGIGMAVIFPTFWPALIGFCLVGFGAAFIVPMTFMLASTNKKYSHGIIISIIATYSIVGMLVGPPMIGYIAHAFNLRVAFVSFALSGLMLIPISRLFFKLTK